tara:strand:- start:7355 stop:7711 length:357 start_codon:yes stop_codon:yes gene_type:complete
MRTDLDSMNPGKAMAQASHASNQFVANTNKEDPMYLKWLDGRTFGTVLVLDVDLEELEVAIDDAINADFHAEVIHDPTYPIKDGEVTHYIALDTCGFVFGDKDDLALKSFLEDLELHS